MVILLLFYTNLKLPGIEGYTDRWLERSMGIMDISPAPMAIHNDGKQRMFFACDDGDGDGKGKVYAYDSDWNLMWTRDVGIIKKVTKDEPMKTKGKEERKKCKEVGISISGAVFKPLRQFENGIEDFNPVITGGIFIEGTRLHLRCLLSYYSPIRTTYVEILDDNGIPISVEYFLEILESNIMLNCVEYTFKNITFSCGSGIIIGCSALDSRIGRGPIKRNFFYPITFGVSFNTLFALHLGENIYITPYMNAKHYVFTKKDSPYFRVEGISGGIGIEYHFKTSKRWRR